MTEAEEFARILESCAEAREPVTLFGVDYVPERMCHITVKDNLNESEGRGDVWYECDECHWQVDYYILPPDFTLNYCPNCGRLVVAP